MKIINHLFREIEDCKWNGLVKVMRKFRSKKHHFTTTREFSHFLHKWPLIGWGYYKELLSSSSYSKKLEGICYSFLFLDIGLTIRFFKLMSFLHNLHMVISYFETKNDIPTHYAVWKLCRKKKLKLRKKIRNCVSSDD